jgi:hypothetical protein
VSECAGAFEFDRGPPVARLKTTGEGQESGAVGGPSRFILPVAPVGEEHQRTQYGEDKEVEEVSCGGFTRYPAVGGHKSPVK